MGSTRTPPAGRGWVMSALLVTMGLAAVDTTVIATVMPQIVGDLGGFSQMAWAFSAYVLTQTVTIPLYGRLADLYGRRPMLLIGVGVFVIGSALCGLAWSMPALIGFRLLQGIGAGAVQTLVQTVAGDQYDEAELGRVQSWIASVWAVCGVLGPVVGGVVAAYGNWRWVFYLNVPVGIAAMVLLATKLRDVERAQRQHRLDLAGGALLLAGAGLLITALLQGGVGWAWTSPVSVSLLLSAVLLLGLLVWWERRAPQPMLPLGLWGNRTVAGANLATVAAGMVMLPLATYLPTHLQVVHGAEPLVAGGVYGLSVIGWTLMAPVAGRLCLRVGHRLTAVLGFGCILTGALTLGLPASLSLAGAVGGCVVLGGGFGLAITSMVIGLTAAAEGPTRGSVMGSNMFSRYVGQALGAAVMGAVANTSLTTALRTAPEASALTVDEAVRVTSAGSADPALLEALRASLESAMGNVYLGMAVAAALGALVVLAAPRRFTTRPILAPGTTPDASRPEPATETPG
jgi:EmrB/QacA subfamily drug resistance transporter